MKVRLKAGHGKHHRRDGKMRIVHMPGEVFEVTSLEYERIKDKVDRLDKPAVLSEDVSVSTVEPASLKKEEEEEEERKEETKEELESKPEPERPRKLQQAAQGMWDVINKSTGQAINDEPLNLDAAKLLL